MKAPLVYAVAARTRPTEARCQASGGCMATQDEKQLLGPWMAVALVIGNIIGAGIFLLPQSLAPFGQNAIYAWPLTIAGALCLAWVFAQLASRIGGGPYAYVRESFGEMPTGIYIKNQLPMCCLV